MLKINLACGTDIRDDFINLDVVKKWPMARRACDVLWDARKDQLPFGDNTVDHVYAGYLLLHIQQRHHDRVLWDIHRVMKPGAFMIVGEIDYKILTKRWLDNPSDPYLLGLMFGEQGIEHGEALADFDKHCTGFTEESLVRALSSHGFRNARRVS